MTDIAVVIPARGSRAWHQHLVERLRAAGHDVSIEHGEHRDEGEAALDAVLRLEAMRFGSALAAVGSPIAASADAAPPDLIVDLTGAAAPRQAPSISLLFDGAPSLSAAARAFVSGRSPDLTVLLDGKPAGAARPMMGERIWLSRGLDNVLARAMTLLERTVRQFAAGELQASPAPAARGAAAPLTAPLALQHMVALGPRLALQALHKTIYREFHWGVGYRFVDGPGVAEIGSLAGGPPWTLLEDDGTRFYADPFPFFWEGGQYLFVEDYPHAARKGLISVVEFNAGGEPGRPRVVLEEPWHLSYPQVFARDGAVWMLPESSGARRLVLYRADPFPRRWVADTVLLEGIQISDATLLDHQGRLWLFASVGDGLGSASDALHVYSAEHLRGPWVPHVQNPIQIDRAAARPGGACIQNASGVVLPLQDGTRHYGGGLGLSRLLELDSRSVRLSPPEPVGNAPGWPFPGIHTLNRAGRLEAIDGIKPRLRWARH